jgi:ribosome-associated protein
MGLNQGKAAETAGYSWQSAVTRGDAKAAAAAKPYHNRGVASSRATPIRSLRYSPSGILQPKTNTLKRTPELTPTVDPDSGYDKPSKSAMKRAMTARQELGQALVELSKEALARVPLPEDLEQAVLEARKINDHEGRRRQMQYIGKLMRHCDPVPIEAAMEEIRGVSHAATARLHQIEAWRERLISDEQALDGFIAKYLEDAEVIGTLRTTIRLARKERESSRPPKHQRLLFQHIKALIEAKD